MTETPNSTLSLQTFIDQWTDSPERTRKAFLQLKQHMENKENVRLEFIPREGLTYSLRASRTGQTRPLFAMIDVIEDDPRWLSVCFYGDMIDDPEEMGDFVPGGLLGEDGHCFDVESFDPDDLTYIEQRMDEAHANAPRF